MYLNQKDFLKTLFMRHRPALKKYEELRFKLSRNPTNYAPLFIKCYRCHKKGHIALQCDFFFEIEGNLVHKDIQTKMRKQR
mmetsp:Transcript_17945/g.27752  ORF Transcript_17945/g.27752 Transcript_17945/m.27752 type:complete len:81 (+) Transcript_17945:1308-1550(+)